jgi:hypothetical protein
VNRLDNARTVALRLDPVRTLHAQKNLERLDAYRAKVAAEVANALEKPHPMDHATLEELPALLRGFDIEYCTLDGETFTNGDLEAAARARARLKFARVPVLTQPVERRIPLMPDGTNRVCLGVLAILNAIDMRAHTDLIARAALFALGVGIIVWGALTMRKAVTQ